MANTLNFGNGKWGVQDGLALAYNDENNNFKPLPFDFTRDSIGTYVDRDGLIKTASNNVPRVDFTDSTDGALLLEPARTNSLPYSDDFTWSGWIKGAGGTGSTPVVTANYGISPDGTQNADRLQLNKGAGTTTGDLSYIYDTIISVGTGSISIWMKSNDSNNYDIALRHVNFTIATVTPEWQRFELNNQASCNEFQLMLRGTYGTSDSADVLIYGAQLEAGSYATSYIPTSGSAVERVGETPSQTPTTGIIGQTEGTIYFESEINGLQGSDMRFQLSDGSASNWIFISAGEATGTGVKGRGYINNGNVNQFSAYSVYLSAGKHKYALAYKQNDIAFYVDGTQVLLDTTATIPSLNKISLCGSTPLNETSSHFQKYDDIKLYNTRLSNSELAKLTTT